MPLLGGNLPAKGALSYWKIHSNWTKVPRNTLVGRNLILAPQRAGWKVQCFFLTGISNLHDTTNASAEWQQYPFVNDGEDSSATSKESNAAPEIPTCAHMKTQISLLHWKQLFGDYKSNNFMQEKKKQERIHWPPKLWYSGKISSLSFLKTKKPNHSQPLWSSAAWVWYTPSRN